MFVHYLIWWPNHCHHRQIEPFRLAVTNSALTNHERPRPAETQLVLPFSKPLRAQSGGRFLLLPSVREAYLLRCSLDANWFRQPQHIFSKIHPADLGEPLAARSFRGASPGEFPTLCAEYGNFLPEWKYHRAPITRDALFSQSAAESSG